MDNNNRKHKRILGYSFLSILFATLLAFGVVLSNVNFEPLSIKGLENDYSITLNSSNKVTTSGSHTQKTKKGNDIAFTYSGVAASTNGHVTLNSSGTLINDTPIWSVETLCVTFNTEDSLKLKLSYDGSSTSGETNLVSGYTYNLGSNPYFLHFSATKTVEISSIVITYSCTYDPSLHSSEVEDEASVHYEKVTSTPTFNGSTKYLIVYESNSSAYIFNGNLTTLDATNNYVLGSIDSNGHIASTSNIENAYFTINSSGNIKSKSGYYIGNGSDSNGLSSSTSYSYTNTVTIEDEELVIQSNGGAYLRFNPTSGQSRFRYFRSSTYYNQEALALYQRVETSAGSHTEWDTPNETEIGFSAVDSKANTYKTTDVFDTANGLSVKALFTGGGEETLSKGGENGYSYVVKNSNNVAIDTSKAFGGEDNAVYYLHVSYKNYEPIIIQLNVSFEVLLTGINVNCDTLTFTTAQKLSDFTSEISADLTYNKASENKTGIEYSQFSSYNLQLTLLNPSSVSYSISSTFGTAGTWKIKIASTTKPSIYGELEITVNAIPVTSISVTGENNKTSIEVEQQLQLTASVQPTNATNQNVTWSSNKENIATVNLNGLVTGVAVGTATISATAQDGSTKVGSIDITVTAKTTIEYVKYSGTITEGNYIITYDNGAMNHTVSSDRLQYTAVSPSNDKITNPDKSIVWSITQSGDYWTIKNTDTNEYAASTGAKNKAQMLSSGTDSKSLWTISGSNTYEFVNKQNTTNNVNANLRKNTTYGFACYGTDIGGALTLYKLDVPVTPIYPTAISLSGGNTVYLNKTLQLTVGYTPATTNVKNVTFSSSNEQYATVDNTGLVTAVAAGTTTITATAETANGGSTSAQVQVTVSKKAVTGVTLTPTELSLKEGATGNLTAVVSPSDATYTGVNWSSSDTSVATVANGVVTAKKAGSATITVTTVDENKSATCDVTVTAKASGSSDIIDKDATYGDLGTSSDSTWVDSFGVSLTNANYTIKSMGTKNTNNALKWNASDNSYLYSTSNKNDTVILSIDVVAASSKTINVYLSNSPYSSNSKSGAETGTISTSSGTGSYTPTGDYKYVLLTGGTSSLTITSITITYGSPTPVSPTNISITPSSLELAKGDSRQLNVSYTPVTANTDLDVTWSRYSGSSTISVSSTGLVSVDSNASLSDTAVIRATLDADNTKYANCTVSVVEQVNDDQTILIYMCGSDLESGWDGESTSTSDHGYASKDISEMLSNDIGVDQPDNVNVVIQTGGAKAWASTHGINAQKTGRYHIENQTLVQDGDLLNKANFGTTATLQSFLTWGIQNYYADRISLVLWNHGGAMRGVCYDENYGTNGDPLLNSEVEAALSNTFTALGRPTSNKLEWIGYDACVMQVQDIAEFNSTYFKYMVGSEELENGGGWDYDAWLDESFSNADTPTILTAICDGFVEEGNWVHYTNGTKQYNENYNDQTLSWLDLSLMPTYKSAWETMASTLYPLINSYGKSNFQTLVKSAKHYADTYYTYSELQEIAQEWTQYYQGTYTVQDVIDEYGLEQSGNYYYDYGYYYYGVFDAYDLMSKIKSTSAFSSASTQITNAMNALKGTNNQQGLVRYSKKGKVAGNSNGLTCFFPLKNSVYNCGTSTYYAKEEDGSIKIQTHFTTWWNIVNSFGD